MILKIEYIIIIIIDLFFKEKIKVDYSYLYF